MKLAAPLFALTLCAFTVPGFAADEGSAAVDAIGRVNGVALACQQPALVSRARNAVINIAPKTRGYGEIFETATNAAYLDQGQGKACPDVQTLLNDLGAAEKRLQAAFPPAR
jgi:hypothetical protein